MRRVIDIDDKVYELINKTGITIDWNTAFHGKEKDREMTFAIFDLVEALKNGIPYKETISAYEIAGLTEVSRNYEMKFKAVRVYRHKGLSELDTAFEQGWQFVRASEFVPEYSSTQGYIEYILMKEFD